jgi:hypothetical protein
MADFFTPDQLAILTAGTVRCDMVVKFEFSTGTQYAWNGNTPLVVDGNTYQAMRGYGQIDGLGYAGEGSQSQAVTLSLDGLPGKSLDILSAALADTPVVDQQLLLISLQLFNADWAPVGSPLPIFYGFMQPPKITRSTMEGTEGAVQSIAITAENAFFNRARPAYGRYTDRDQQARSPGDKFFGFVSSLLSKTIRYPDY